MRDLIGAYDRINRVYRMYIESAFPFRSRALNEERRHLLARIGALSQLPVVETVPNYPSSKMTLAQASEALPAEYRDLYHLARPLFKEQQPLWQHQWDSLRTVIRDRKDIVVTTGTGSGKTECYLLPLLAELARESKGWAASQDRPAESYWWRVEPDKEDEEFGWRPQWGHTGRAAQGQHALRAVILYPLNALVEDQLRRLRACVESEGAHQWLDLNREKNRILFARYTGLTPVPGRRSKQKVKELREELQELEAQWEEVRRTGDPDLRNFFANPAGGEMWSRWDSQETPPDILVTNYSMLNNMLMRTIERDIFDKTKEWLAGDEHRRFFLIVDELHAYRGTPGTEVAYLVRLLLHRLGLDKRPDQLSILATSASVDEKNDKSKDFVRQFFGREWERFKVISSPEERPRPGALQAVRGRTKEFADFARAIQADPLATMRPLNETGNETHAAMRQLVGRLGRAPKAGESPEVALGLSLEQLGAPDALRAACAQAHDGTIRPTRADRLEPLLFQDPTVEPYPTDPAAIPGASPALRGFLAALSLARDPKDAERAVQPVRGHLFLHNQQGLWVCINPDCTHPHVCREERPKPEDVDRLRCGALHHETALSCSCGGRVLDLIVCEVCGEVFFGGYRAKRETDGDPLVILTPDMPDLEALPDDADLGDRTHGRYALFWPLAESPLPDVTYRSENMYHDWLAARLRISSGQLLVDEEEAGSGELAGKVYSLRPLAQRGRNWRDVSREEALPPICPGCGADYSSPQRRINTPLRWHRTGFQKACQVIASALVREMPEPKDGGQQPRKLVIFSDSRQDAAKLAAGIERDHYRDLVRVAMVQAPEEFRRSLTAFCRHLVEDFPRFANELAVQNGNLAAAAQEPGDAQDAERARWFEDFDEEIANRALRWARGRIVATDTALQDFLNLVGGYPSRFGLPHLAMAVFRELLRCGVCPGGTEFNILNYRQQANDGPWVPWWTCYDWQAVVPRPRDPLTGEQRSHISSLEQGLLAELMYALFPHKARTFEGLGQGWVTFGAAAALPSEQRQLLDAIIRMLGIRRLHTYRGVKRFIRYYPVTTLPKYVERYASAATGDSATQVSERLVEQGIIEGRTAEGEMSFLLNPRKLYLERPASQDREKLRGWRCPRCGSFYMHRANELCPECVGTRGAEGQGESVVLREEPLPRNFDYYFYLSEQSGGVFRFRSEELTGQTDKDDRPSRQRRFQEIFLGEERSRRLVEDRLAQRDDDDGSGGGHRAAPGRDDGQHASAAIQLPAARRPCGPARCGGFLRYHLLPRPQPRRLLLPAGRGHDRRGSATPLCGCGPQGHPRARVPERGAAAGVRGFAAGGMGSGRRGRECPAAAGGQRPWRVRLRRRVEAAAAQGGAVAPRGGAREKPALCPARAGRADRLAQQRRLRGYRAGLGPRGDAGRGAQVAPGPDRRNRRSR
jgi:DEAD/DEAH box helicase domain-containing protein